MVYVAPDLGQSKMCSRSIKTYQDLSRPIGKAAEDNQSYTLKTLAAVGSSRKQSEAVGSSLKQSEAVGSSRQ